jgi:MULE transposase domain
LKYGTDDDGHSNLFYAHHTSIESYPDVILIDATYRVNIYNMPMIHSLGVSATGETFSIAFCFVSAENDLQYYAAAVM